MNSPIPPTLLIDGKPLDLEALFNSIAVRFNDGYSTLFVTFHSPEPSKVETCFRLYNNRAHSTDEHPTLALALSALMGDSFAEHARRRAAELRAHAAELEALAARTPSKDSPSAS
jgi:hypothetical protein